MTLRTRLVDGIFGWLGLCAAILEFPRRLRAIPFPGYRRAEDAGSADPNASDPNATAPFPLRIVKRRTAGQILELQQKRPPRRTLPRDPKLPRI